MISTASEVREFDRVVQEEARRIQEVLDALIVKRFAELLLCHHFLGFSVVTNRSPKRSRRLRHSLCVQFLKKPLPKLNHETLL